MAEAAHFPFHRPSEAFYGQRLKHWQRLSIILIVTFWIVINLTIAVQSGVGITETRKNYHKFDAFCLRNATEGRFDCTKPLKVMPWLLWFPFDTASSPGYEIGFFYAVVLLVFNACYAFNFDMFIMTWMMFIAFQFEILANDLVTLRDRLEVEALLESDSGSIDEDIVNRRMYSRLSEICRHHNRLIK